jgi:hypothetical protein
VGVRRGRRDPVHLRVGDAVDFWRVEKLETGRTLKLRAEMILPGIAWLEFTVEEVSEGNTNRRKITQEAIYQPRGLLGALYWWVVSPFHFLIFPTMIKNLIRSAKRRDLEMDIVIH